MQILYYNIINYYIINIQFQVDMLLRKKWFEKKWLKKFSGKV